MNNVHLNSAPASTHLTIVVLDGFTTQALACVRSLGRAGHKVLVASRHRVSLAGASRYCAGRFRLETETVDGFRALREWSVRRGATVALPMTEQSCILCNEEREAWAREGIRLGCPPAEMLSQAFDKAQTIKAAIACNVRTPLTRTPASLAECCDIAADVGFPCVVKSRFSHAWDGHRFHVGRGASYANNLQELQLAVQANRQGHVWPIVQQFAPGCGKGVFALCNHGSVVAWFAHERLRDVRPSGSGSTLRRSIAVSSRLRDPAARLLAEMKWHGPAMVEFRDDGAGQPCLMEVNGRFWSSLQLGIDAGVDFPRLWLALLVGQPLPAGQGYVAGRTLRWLWGDMKRLLHIINGPPVGYPGRFPTLWQGVAEVIGPQPRGTRIETWESADLAPALAEWLQGMGEVFEAWRSSHSQRGRTSSPAVVQSTLPSPI